jgi:predicted O-methyltransferase YrrM
MLRQIYNQVFEPLHWARSVREFDSQLARTTSTESLTQMLWSYKGRGFFHGFYPNQHHWEIAQLAERIAIFSPRVIVELGTRDGATLFLWTQLSPHTRHVVSVDLPGGIHGGGYPEQRGKLYRYLVKNRPNCQLTLLRRDSQQASTRDEVAALLGGQPIDFLFIDADHRYEGVRKDYQLYAPLVRPGGLIAFHDIRHNTRDTTIQVDRLWDEIRAGGARIEEIVHEPYTGRYGIGLLWVS